jgi:hypothetical protein
MSKTPCLTRGCTNASVGNDLCAIHHPEYGVEGVEGERVEDEGASGVLTSSGRQPELAVNASEQPERKRCRALTVQGKPCLSPTVGPDGLCATHSGRAGFGTVETARKGAKASVKARRERAEAREARVEEARMSLTDLLRVRALERNEGLVKALLDAAETGRDVPALRMVWDRLDGKVPEVIEVDSSTPKAVEDLRAMSMEERIAFIRARTAQVNEAEGGAS